MRTQKSNPYIYIAVSLLSLALSIHLLVNTPFSKLRGHSQTNGLPHGRETSSRIEEALASKVDPVSVSFTTMESPFRPFKLEKVSTPTVKKSVSTPPERNNLRLKGLMNSTKLAIIEDAKGETFIRGQGEKVLNTLILSVSNNGVVLKDSLGTYELTVEEKR